MLYLTDKQTNELLPQGAARYDVFRWMFWAGEQFRQPAPIYFEERLIAKLMGKPADEARIAEADRLIKRFAPYGFDARLEQIRGRIAFDTALVQVTELTV